MTTITVINRDGVVSEVAAATSGTVMEALRDGGFDEILALCGGCCSCSTCHIYVDPAYVDRLPAMSVDEDELLESSAHRTELSRLSCQLPVDERTAGLSVTIPPED